MSEKPQILILNYEYPPIGGGGGIISKYIAEGLSNSYNITIVTTWIKGLEEISKKNDTTIIRLKSKRRNNYRSNPVEMLSWIKHSKKFLTKHCIRNKYDLCIANFAIPGGNVAKYLKNKFNIPYIIISHGHDIPWVKPYSLYPLHFLNYYTIKSICHKASSVCVQTEDMFSNLTKFAGNKNKNMLIHNGFDPDIFFPDYKKRPDKLKILFTGRLVKQKDPLTFLKAIQLFHKNNKNFDVTMIGDGPLRKKIEQYISKHKLSDKITLKGKIAYNQVAEELQSAHLYISTSISEGMSISMIEAIACGAYIITTQVSGTKEVIEENVNGEFIGFKSSSYLASKITEFYETKFSNNFVIESSFFDNFRKKFSWNNIVKEYDKLIKTTITKI